LTARRVDRSDVSAKARARALANLREAYKALAKRPADAEFLEYWRWWCRALFRAARLGILDEPGLASEPAIRLAWQHIASHQSLGAEDWLRRARRGLALPARGRLMTVKELHERRRLYAAILATLADIPAGRGRWAALQKRLTADGVITPMSRQSFHELLARLGFVGWRRGFVGWGFEELPDVLFQFPRPPRGF
jgi:hypothetical protein